MKYSCSTPYINVAVKPPDMPPIQPFAHQVGALDKAVNLRRQYLFRPYLNPSFSERLCWIILGAYLQEAS